MNIAAKKVEIIEWLVQLNDEQIISKVEKLKNQSIKEMYELRLKPMSANEYKLMLEEAEEDYKKGRIIDQRGLEKESETW
jgi:hypothetical protein